MADNGNDKNFKLNCKKNDENDPADRERAMKKASICKITVFLAALFFGAVFSLMIPLRPAVSEQEKRALAKFPQFTFESFADGTYFADIDTWFSDTFPMRDRFIACNEEIKGLYGFRNSVIHGEIVAGDAIPEYDNQERQTAENGEQESGGSKDSSTGQPTGGGKDSGTGQPTGGGKDGGTNGITEETKDENDKAGSAEAETAQKGEKFGSVYVLGDSAYGYYSFLKDNSDRYVRMVNSFSDALDGQADLYNMIVPTSMDIMLDDNVRGALTSSNQYDAIRYMSSKMDSSVNMVEVYRALKSRKNEYIYFRTDHHWTALGAYYAYCEFVRGMGMIPNPIGSYERIDMGEFNGSFFTQTGAASLKSNPDSITAYKPASTNSMKFLKKGAMIDYNIITDVSDWSKSGKYNTFIGGDNAYSEIHNPKITDGSSCVVVKESFGNAFVPFIVDHFQDIYVIDYRYYSGTVSDLVKEKGIGTVLLLNNVSATSTDARINELEKVCR